MRRAILSAALVGTILVAPGGAQPEQDEKLMVFASDRTATLIPTEVRVVDVRTGRSSRVGVVSKALPERLIWSPNGRQFAYVSVLGGLYVVRPGHRPRRVARRLGATDDRPAWSPSGRLLAYFGRDRGRLSVYVVRAAGGGLRRVAKRIADAPDLSLGDGLAWSPDGRRLAIAASRDPRYRLVVADVRTRRLRRLDTGRGRPSEPDWSPDGRTIAFRAQVPAERASVRTIDLESGRLRRLRAGGGTPLWSPDGRSLAIDEKHRLWVLRNGGARLVATHIPLSDPPVWSPDSRRLTFMARGQLIVAEAARKRTKRLTRETRVFSPESTLAWTAANRVVYVGYRRDPGDLDLHLVREDGTGIRALTRNNVAESTPTWSPDRRFVAYTSGADPAAAAYVIGADGEGARRVVANAFDPSWSPDGTRLAVVRGGDIWIAPLDGSAPLQLTFGAAVDSGPAWSPLGDEIAFARKPNVGENGELYTARVARGQLRKITDEGALNVGCARSNAQAPAWSPDGSRLAYESDRGGSNPCGPTRGHTVSVVVIRADGTGRRVLTDGGYHDAISDDGALTPTWSPDGTQVAFISAVGQPEPEYDEWWRIGIVPAAGGPFRLITPRSFRANHPDWGR